VKPRPFDDVLLRDLARRFGTPLFVYGAEILLERARELASLRDRGRGFDVVRYAQKANPNLSILALLRRAGVAVDAVSAGELRRALAAGYEPRDVLFCADLFDRDSLAMVRELPFRVNLGSPDMLDQYAAADPPRRDVVLRINPGFGHGHDRKVTTGGELSKHGIWHESVGDVAERAHALGLEIRGLHVHIGSGADPEHLARASRSLLELSRRFEGTLDMLSAGGGLPIPYREGEPRPNLARVLESWNGARIEIERRCGRPIRLEAEPGRYLVAEAGVLLAEVRALKRSGSVEYALVDAGFHNLVRPAMYGAYHDISVIGRDGEPRVPLAVAGPLCESADVFTVGKGGVLEPRELPRPRIGDLMCFHDAGAYAASMASTYNTQLPAAEVLVQNGSARLIRRRQDFDDLLAPEAGLLE
jgi:diaminopimelate decarboxylase